ncbi:PD-(D/E)XK nuclease family protein, partial [Candidatus Latescibacterota bacterium]
TALTDYRECPALYRYRHIDRIEDALSGGSGGGFGVRYGTAVHTVLETWDFADGDHITERIEQAAEKIEPSRLQDTFKASFARFTGSSLYQSIQLADEQHREEPFAFIHNDVVIRGSIDLRVKTGDSIMLVDYKTTHSDSGDIKEMKESHRLQICLYGLAVYKATGIIPSKLVVYYFSQGQAFDIPCDEALLEEIEDILSATITSLDRGEFEPLQQDVFVSVFM